METRIKTITHKHNNMGLLIFGGMCLYFIVLGVGMAFASLTLKMDFSIISRRWFYYNMMTLLSFLPVALIMFLDEWKVKNWKTVERFVEVRDGKVWRRLKGVKVK